MSLPSSGSRKRPELLFGSIEYNPPSMLDEWMIDFERKLIDRGLPKRKYIAALKIKIPGIETRLKPPTSGYPQVYEEYRDLVLRTFGPKDPWLMMIKRIAGYAPVNTKTTQVIMDLERLTTLWIRIAQRLYANTQQVITILINDIIPREIMATLQRGLTPVQRMNTNWLFQKGAIPSLDEVLEAIESATPGSTMDFSNPLPHFSVRTDVATTETNTYEMVNVVQDISYPKRMIKRKLVEAHTLTKKKPKVMCSYCKKTNHSIQDCWFKHPDKRPTNTKKRVVYMQQPQPKGKSEEVVNAIDVQRKAELKQGIRIKPRAVQRCCPEGRGRLLAIPTPATPVAFKPYEEIPLTPRKLCTLASTLASTLAKYRMSLERQVCTCNRLVSFLQMTPRNGQKCRNHQSMHNILQTLKSPAFKPRKPYKTTTSRYSISTLELNTRRKRRRESLKPNIIKYRIVKSKKAKLRATKQKKKQIDQKLKLLLTSENIPTLRGIAPITSTTCSLNSGGAVTTAKAFTLIGKRVTPTLFDTGAAPSVLHLKVWQELLKKFPKWPWQATPTDKTLVLPNKTYLATHGITTIPITVLGRVYHIEVYISPKLPIDLLIGLPTMHAMGATIDTRELRIYFKADPHRALKIQAEEAPSREVYIISEEVYLPPYTQSVVGIEARPLGLAAILPPIKQRTIRPYTATERYKHLLIAPGVSKERINKILIANPNSYYIRLIRGTRIAVAEATDSDLEVFSLEERPSGIYDELEEEMPTKVIRSLAKPVFAQIWKELNPNIGQLSASQLNRVKELIKEFQNLWSVEGMPLTTTQAATHIIDTGTTRPLAQRPRPTGPAQKEEIQKQVEQMLKDSIISPSQSPWASPIVLVKKKDGAIRFCIDYRKLNEVTIKDHYPLPRIDDIIDTTGGSIYFSTLDLRSGYWQVPVAKEDRPKTAFVTYGGLYEYNVMPFGLTNAPATFQRLMDAVLAGLRWQTCLVYLDDIIVFSTDFDTHIQRLRQVFTRLRQHNLSLKPNKCELFRTEVTYLGHIINQEGIKPQQDKIEKVKFFPKPKNRRAIRAFLGLAGYYRRFIQNFASIAKPLYQLTSEKESWVWGKQQEQAFEQLKKCSDNRSHAKLPTERMAGNSGYRCLRRWVWGYSNAERPKWNRAGYCICEPPNSA